MADNFMIVVNGQPMDGEIFDRAGLMRNIRHASYDATIFAFDLSEGLRDGATSMRDETELLVSDWFHAEGLNETYDTIESGKGAPGLACRFFSDECAAYEQKVEAA